MNKKIIRGLVVVFVTLCLPCTAITLITGWGYASALNAQPEEVSITYDAPSEVRLGESFTIEIRVKNLADVSQSLEAIDFSHSYLAGIKIQSATPSFDETQNFENLQSYLFSHNIPPGDSLVVKFSAAGVKVGEFSGPIGVCINMDWSCAYSDRLIVVKR